MAVALRRSVRAYTHRSRTTIGREGIYFALLTVSVFVFALLGDVNLLVVLAGMLVGPLWLSWRLVTRTLRGLRVVRTMSHSVCAGDPVVVKVALTNGRRRLGRLGP